MTMTATVWEVNLVQVNWVTSEKRSIEGNAANLDAMSTLSRSSLVLQSSSLNLPHNSSDLPNPYSSAVSKNARFLFRAYSNTSLSSSSFYRQYDESEP
ncbi:hypothetical protein ACHAWO_010803 [Cyclotella atomus]|uniref:Uncharacterized protein n=1 Tax=Cyclotella atomus TaxID=382360 RepID=A0ABD3NC67_9STRA